VRFHPSQLAESERDALAEIASIGVTKAANSLRQLVGEQVLLSVPKIEIVTREIASRTVARDDSARLVAVQQSFEGPFIGRALLIFPEAQSIELVRSIIGADHSLDDVVDFEEEALAETGNIILNACLATIANVLRRTLRMSLPSVVKGDGAKLFQLGEIAAADDFVLFLFIDFAIRNRELRGFIALLMDMPSIAALREIVRDFITELEKRA
jgi:chemotaxis protein CheC